MTRPRRTTFTIQPQRRAAGWTACLDHEAQRWVVIAVTRSQERGRSFHASRKVAAFGTKGEAEAEQLRLTRVAKPLPRPTLGQRFARTGRRIIARSLSYDQYHQQKED